MSFTKVAPAGIGTEPGDGYRIGDSFLHSTGINLGSGSTISHSGNATFTGIITAASFSGSGSGLTGVASTDNIKTSTTANFTGGIQVGGAATFTGDVGIGGTLTYEDVSNIDSVGIITARTGVIVGSGVTLNATGVIATGIVTASSYRGDGSQLTGITGTTINNNADNRVITGSGTANTLNGESELTYDGSGLLSMVSTGSNSKIKFQRTGTSIGGHIQTRDESDDKGLTYVAQDGNSAKAGHVFITDQTSDGSSPQERLRITPDGYVGINTSSPQYPLHVTGYTTNSAPDGIGVLMGLQHNHALIHLNAATNLGCIIDFSTPSTDRRGGILYYHSENSTVANRDAMQFHTAGSERFRITSSGILAGANGTTGIKIDSAGKVMIGTETKGSTSGDELTIEGSGIMGMVLRTDSTTGKGNILFADGLSGSDRYTGGIVYEHQYDRFRFNVNGGQLAQQINSDKSTNFYGSVTATNYITSSDIALKDNIATITNSLEKIKQIKGCTFNLKETGEHTVGVIAQDVEKVLPQLIRGEEGEKGVQYNGLIGLLIEAVKELSDEIEKLKLK